MIRTRHGPPVVVCPPFFPSSPAISIIGIITQVIITFIAAAAADDDDGRGWDTADWRGTRPVVRPNRIAAVPGFRPKFRSHPSVARFCRSPLRLSFLHPPHPLLVLPLAVIYAFSAFRLASLSSVPLVFLRLFLASHNHHQSWSVERVCETVCVCVCSLSGMRPNEMKRHHDQSSFIPLQPQTLIVMAVTGRTFGTHNHHHHHYRSSSTSIYLSPFHPFHRNSIVLPLSRRR